MRVVGLASLLASAVACSHDGARVPSAGSPPSTVETERAENEWAYRQFFLPSRAEFAADDRGAWTVIARGLFFRGRSIEEADAAARDSFPRTKHRFVFRLDDEGDVEWPLGGCELPNVLGNRFYALLERDDVGAPKGVGPDGVLYWFLGDTYKPLTVASPTGDSRMFLRPNVGPPGAAGAADATYCLSTGFGGFATMSAGDAAGLELWEIPGVAKVRGALRSGDCRRAYARFAWPDTSLDFVVPVAIWPK